ncbi:uncharacterized protein LOC101849101 [Aplysia californica]|uniref:Uncharacterized protein LOC101849101 n=1 Tax=Aplysia californica TaxID=6500 RepID=A0ABM1W3K8_APLCA|nr:uncharacterized protein LOC101849101 [Aplysia californica]
MFKSKRFTAITAGDVSKTTRESQKNVPAQRVDQKGKLLFDPNKYKLTSKRCFESEDPSELSQTGVGKDVGNLAFLENFPTLKLLEEAEGNVYLAYFRTGKVVTASTKFSVFVYVVKYGSCRALVELSPPGYKKRLGSETKEDESKPLPPSTVPKSVGCVVRPSLKTQVVQLPGRLSSLNIPLGLSMERAHQLVTEIVDKPTRSPSIALDRSFKAEADMYRRRSMNMTRRGSTALQNQKRNSGDKGERGSIQVRAKTILW